jgi:general secretion pathway protein C
MVSNPGNRWAVAATTFVVWGLVAATAVYWAMKLSNTGSAEPVAPAVRAAPPPDPVAVARLLGSVPSAQAQPTVAPLSSRFQLFGVVSGGTSGGAALLSVDGKPPRPYRVGAPVDENLVLQSVEPRRVTLASSVSGPPTVSLELPLKR